MTVLKTDFCLFLILQVRVPTAEGGNCVFWEFATDGHDIGFGVYFEWVKPSTSQVSVHVSESEDDDCDDLEDDDDGNINQGINMYNEKMNQLLKM